MIQFLRLIELIGADGRPWCFVRAEIIGSLGVHPGMGDESDRWMVTHVPTGNLVADCDSKQIARTVAEWIEAQVTTKKRKAWMSSDREKARRVFSNPRKMRERIDAKVKITGFTHFVLEVPDNGGADR